MKTNKSLRKLSQFFLLGLFMALGLVGSFFGGAEDVYAREAECTLNNYKIDPENGTLTANLYIVKEKLDGDGGNYVRARFKTEDEFSFGAPNYYMIEADDWNETGADSINMDVKIIGMTEEKTYMIVMDFWDTELIGADQEDNYMCTFETISANMRDPEDYGAEVDLDQKYAAGKPRFTWLEGTCLNEAKDMQLSAVSCVITNTINLLLSFTGIISTGLVVIGGFVLVISHTDEMRDRGKKIISYAIIGLVVTLLSYVITQIIIGGGIVF